MKVLSILVLASIGMSIVGCKQGVPPFRNILVCLNDSHQVTEYKTYVENYAVGKGFKFTDNTQRMIELQTRNNTLEAERRAGRQSIFVRVDSEIGLSFTVSNWDTEETAIAHSFLAVANEEDASEITSQFIDQVSSRWEVFELPIKEIHYPRSCEDAQSLE